MDLHSFKDTLTEKACPQNLSTLQKALWYIKKDQWRQSHDIVENMTSADAAWVHALLHRIEGDQGNAGYWYRRAGKEYPQISLEEEWDEIAKALH